MHDAPVRWCLRLRDDVTGALRWGDALYQTQEQAHEAAVAWNALRTGETAEAMVHPSRPLRPRHAA